MVKLSWKNPRAARIGLASKSEKNTLQVALDQFILIWIASISFYCWRAGISVAYDEGLSVGWILFLKIVQYMWKEWDLVSGVHT